MMEDARRFSDQKLLEMVEHIAMMRGKIEQIEDHTRSLPEVRERAKEAHHALFSNGSLIKRVASLEHWRTYLLGAWALVMFILTLILTASKIL